MTRCGRRNCASSSRTIANTSDMHWLVRLKMSARFAAKQPMARMPSKRFVLWPLISSFLTSLCPEMQRLTAGLEIRRLSPATLIVFVPIEDDPGVMELARSCGADGFVNKACGANAFRNILAVMGHRSAVNLFKNTTNASLRVGVL